MILVVVGFLVMEFSVSDEKLENWGWYGRMWLWWRKFPIIVRLAVFLTAIILCVLVR
ncbi:MAG: hypothetical protein LBU46_08330 [Candidatus Accumulibacter sp.]|nr:hypothetical protein [Accumulibacter sp.]